MATVFRLESGIQGRYDKNRDEWFDSHKFFIIKPQKKDDENPGELMFIGLDDYLVGDFSHGWHTTPAKITAKSPDGGYICFETMSSTKYQVIKIATIERIKK